MAWWNILFLQRDGSWIVKAAVTIEYYADGVTTHLAHHGAAPSSAETLQGVSCLWWCGSQVTVLWNQTVPRAGAKRVLSCIPFSSE